MKRRRHWYLDAVVQQPVADEVGKGLAQEHPKIEEGKTPEVPEDDPHHPQSGARWQKEKWQKGEARDSYEGHFRLA